MTLHYKTTTMKIVVADDEVDFRESLIEILELKGHHAFGVGSVGEFLALPSSQDYDLAIIDRQLPDGDGLQILAKIRQTRSVPVVLITGSAEFEQSVESAVHPDLCIAKPFAIEPLLAFLQGLAYSSSK
jgi:two-component system, OmpR family, response regulator